MDDREADPYDGECGERSALAVLSAESIGRSAGV